MYVDYALLRRLWVWAGNLGHWLFVATGVAHFWQEGVERPAWLTVGAASVLCQAVAVAAVVWPGRSASSRDLVDHHASVTLGGMGLGSVFGLLPALMVLALSGAEDRLLEAVFAAGMVLILAPTAGLIGVALLAGRAGWSERAGDGPPMWPDGGTAGGPGDDA
jgi:hypothetical protein